LIQGFHRNTNTIKKAARLFETSGRDLLSRRGRLADFHQDQGRVGTTESKPVVANRHDAGTAGAHHSHRTAGTQTHFAEPMDVVGLPVDLQNRSRFSRCKLVQRHDLAAGSNRVGLGRTLHGRVCNDRRTTSRTVADKPTR
jgi:hypothetical protein